MKHLIALALASAVHAQIIPLTYTEHSAGPVAPFTVCSGLQMPRTDIWAYGDWTTGATVLTHSLTNAATLRGDQVPCATGYEMVVLVAAPTPGPVTQPGSLFNTPVDQVAGMTPAFTVAKVYPTGSPPSIQYFMSTSELPGDIQGFQYSFQYWHWFTEPTLGLRGIGTNYITVTF